MNDLRCLDARLLARAFADKAELEPRYRVEQLLASLDGPTIFEELVAERGDPR